MIDEVVNSSVQTQASSKPKLVCPADKCGHELANKGTLATHIKRFHEGVQLGVQAAKRIFGSPQAGPSSAILQNEVIVM